MFSARTAKLTSLLCPLLIAGIVGLRFDRGTPMTEPEASQDGALPPEVLARITPGLQHQGLAWYLGEWTTASRLTMPGMPEMPPEKGTAKFEWLIDGLWMMSRAKGTLMGRPIEMVHVHGYNKMTMNYETIGFDSYSTDAKFSYGNPVTPDGKTFGFQGFMNEYLTGQVNKPYRTVQTRRGEDRFDLEIWDPEIGPNGAQVIVMEYTRVKK